MYLSNMRVVQCLESILGVTAIYEGCVVRPPPKTLDLGTSLHVKLEILTESCLISLFH